MDEDGNVGSGYCKYHGLNTQITSGQISFGLTIKTYDVELSGATKGSKAATKHFMAKFSTNVAVYLDNEEAAICLHIGNLIPSSSKVIANFQKLRDTWHNRLTKTVALELLS